MGNTKIKIPGIDGVLTSAYIKIPNIDGEITKIYVGNDLVYQKITTSTITPRIINYGQISPSTATTGNVGTQETFSFTYPALNIHDGTCYVFERVKLYHLSTTYQEINRDSTPIQPQTRPQVFSTNPYVSVPITYQSVDCTLGCDISGVSMSSSSGYTVSLNLTTRQTTRSKTFTLNDISSGLSVSNLEGRYLTIAGLFTSPLGELFETIVWPTRATQEVTVYQYSSTAYSFTITLSNTGTFTLTITRGTSTSSITVTFTLHQMMFW